MKAKSVGTPSTRKISLLRNSPLRTVAPSWRVYESRSADGELPGPLSRATGPSPPAWSESCRRNRRMVMLLLVVAATITFGVLPIPDARRARRVFTASPGDEPTPGARREGRGVHRGTDRAERSTRRGEGGDP